MPVPFGFSVGDFVTVIELTGKIISSLKDVGGSSSEYQHAVIELESLKRLLEKVTHLTITADNEIQVNSLRGLALACEPCLQEFHRKLKSYEASIGPFAPKSHLKGTFHKIKWAFLGSEEFSQFRKFIAMKVLCLSLLLSMHIFESTSSRDAKEQAGRFSLVDEITKIRESMERLELTNQQSFSKLDYQADLRPIQDTVENVAERLESNLSRVSNALTSVGRAVFGFNNVLGLIIDFLGSFQRETKIALQRIIQTNMQIYALLLASQTSPSAGPSTPSDSIVFEDALGRTISLPYQWFRHWETFEGLLRAEFKGLPGETKVLEGKYHLIDTKGGGAIIRKEDWHRTVFPGSSVTMSVIISQIRWQGGLCPRPSCAEPRIELDRPQALATCKSCGLKYYPSRERFDGQTKRVIVLTEDDEVIWSQSTQDLEVFGARPLPKDPEETAAILALLESADATTANEDVTILSSAIQAAPQTEQAQASHDLTVVPVIENAVAGKIQTSYSLSSEFQTPLDIWLAQTESTGLDPNMISDTPLPDQTRRDEEASEIEHLKRVHIKQWNNNPDDHGRGTGAVDPKWVVEVDEAIYRRNISDRFPLLPPWLTDRLAELNVKRAKRLPRAYYTRTSSSHGGEGDNLDHHPPVGDLPCQPSRPSGDENGPNQDDQLEGYLRKYSPQPASGDVEGKQTQVERTGIGLIYQLRLASQHSIQELKVQPKVRAQNSPQESPQETSFWSGKAGRKGPASTLSRSSHSNNSLQLPDVPLEKRRKTSSVKTHSSRSTVDSSKPRFVVPPPPVDLGKENTFICDICDKKVFVLGRRDWQIHVLRDLQPYSCIFKNCRTPLKTYVSRAAMLSHVLRMHSVYYSYRCRKCPPSKERLEKSEMIRHIRRYHPGTAKGLGVGNPSFNALKYFDKDLREMNCYFCDKALSTTDKFITHIGQHLERIAFAVLARPYQKWHFYDDFASEGLSEGLSAPPAELSTEIAHLIRNNSVTTLKQLLKDGILTKTLCGNSAIWLASQHGHEAIVWLLIQYGFDVNEKDRFRRGRTALHHAAEAGHTSVVKLLLEAGSDPLATTDDDMRALTLAACRGHGSTVRTLWEAYQKRDPLDDLRFSWIFAAENGHSECLRVLKAILEEVYWEVDSGNRSMSMPLAFDVPRWICDGIEAAVGKGMQKSFDEVTTYQWRPPALMETLRSMAASRTVRWVWLSFRNSSLSHLILSNPWLERDWLPTDLSFPDGLTDEFITVISNSLLTVLDVSEYGIQYTRNSAISDVDHLQTLLKQHPEFVQLIYLDLARQGDHHSLSELLRRDLRPHPKTLSTLVEEYNVESVEYLLKHFSSHFRETDRIDALICVVMLYRPQYRNKVLLEGLLRQPIPLFSADGIAAARSAAKRSPELLELLETCCLPAEAACQ